MRFNTWFIQALKKTVFAVNEKELSLPAKTIGFLKSARIFISVNKTGFFCNSYWFEKNSLKFV